MPPYASGSATAGVGGGSPAAEIMRGPLIGSLIGMALYGVTCLQTVFYYRAYPGDRLNLRVLVCLVWVLETAHACMSIFVLDRYLILSFGNDLAVESTDWVFTIMLIIGFMTDLVVYLYFTWKVWAFTRRKWAASFMLLVVLARTAISLWGCAEIGRYALWLDYRKNTLSINIIGNSLFIAGDTFSAAILAYYLRKNLLLWKGSPTNQLLHRLVVYTVATGTLTSLIDVATLVLTVQQTSTLSFIALIIIQTRIYANSLLASLNMRKLNAQRLGSLITMSPNPDIALMSTSLQFAGETNANTNTATESELVRSPRTSASTAASGSACRPPELDIDWRGHGSSSMDVPSENTVSQAMLAKTAAVRELEAIKAEAEGEDGVRESWHTALAMPDSNSDVVRVPPPSPGNGS